MRRQHVYERSATRAARSPRPEPSDDYGPAARATLAAMPELFQQAEAAGAVTLARHLGQALGEAELICHREIISAAKHTETVQSPRSSATAADINRFWKKPLFSDEIRPNRPKK